MDVAREALYRKPEGEDLTLADLGLLVAHLQTTGQAPPDAKVYLRVDQIRVEWSTQQQTDQELREEADRIRAEREAARNQAVEALPADEVAAADPEPADLGIVRGRRGRASSDA